MTNRWTPLSRTNRWTPLAVVALVLVAGGLAYRTFAPDSAPEGPAAAPTSAPSPDAPEAPLEPPADAPATAFAPPAPASRTAVPSEAAPAPSEPPALARREAAAEAPATVPLEDLLRLPAIDPTTPQGLEVDRNPHLRVPPDEVASQAARPSLRDRVRVEHREERVGRPGPAERTVGQTDTHVRVPVKDSVELRGGVRVESERAGDGDLEDVGASPNVGVDVRF